MMIDSRVMEVMSGSEVIPFKVLTKDIKKDFYIIVFYLAEKLPDNIPFDLGKFEIVEYNETTIVVNSNKKEWTIVLDNIYTYDDNLGIEYRFFTIRE